MPDATGSEAQCDTGNSASEQAEQDGPPTVAGLTADLDAAQAALEEANARAEAEADRALRAAAEAENARKRAERSIENARKFALERFVEALLPAVDSFEQAASAAADAASATDAPPVPEVFAEGVRLSLKLLVGAMERHGVAVEDPIGAPFDPTLHEAMSVVENAEAEPDSVTQVFQKGYTLNGRLVRPARVIVARAAQPAADAATGETSTGEGAPEG